MPTLTPRVVREEAFGDVVVSRVEPWTQSELDAALDRRVMEERFRYMPKLTDLSYRMNAGLSALEITPVEGDWDSLFGLLAEHPKRFIEWEADEFIGSDDDGNERTPGLQTTIKTVQREAYRRGLVVGTQRQQIGEHVSEKSGKVVPDYDPNILRICLRTNVKKMPGWFKAFVDDKVPMDLVPVIEETEDVESAEE